MRERLPKFSVWVEGRFETLINQLPESLEEARLLLPKEGSLIATIGGKKVRVSRRSEGPYSAIAISADPDRIKSKKILDQELQIALAAAPIVDAATQRSEQRARRLIHNLKSLTAKTSQELFQVFQQDKMLASPREIVGYMAEELQRAPDEAARAIVEVLKHQSAQKAEYSAFEKLSGKVDSLKFEAHDIHRVLMNVFYLFFGDFVDKKVRATVEPTRLQAVFDYDSIHACIYYLVENAAKYTSQNSALNVTVTLDRAGLVDIRFDMESLEIEADEEQRIFEEGVSGSAAIQRRLQGAGIGLFLAREMARINRGSLNLIAGRATRAGFARNTFVLTLQAPAI